MVTHQLQDVRDDVHTADSDPQVSTAQAATQSQKKLVNKEAGENIYVEVPKIPIKVTLFLTKRSQIYLSDHYANSRCIRHQTKSLLMSMI